MTLRKIEPRKNAPQKNCSPDNCLPEKLFYQIFVAFDIILRLFLLKLFIVTGFRGVSRTPATSIIDLLVTELTTLTNVTKSSCLDVAGVVDLPLNKYVCIHEIMQLIIMKMKTKMRIDSRKYSIKRTSCRHGHKYSI